MRQLLCLVSVAALVALPLPAGARPGGGQNYKSSSSSTRSSSSSSTRSSSSSSTRSSSSSYRPSTSSSSSSSYSSGAASSSSSSSSDDGGGGVVIFIMLIIVVFIVVWALRKRGGGARATVSVSARRKKEGLGELRAHDPEFDQAAFAQRTKATLAKINEAWVEGNMTKARRLVSDGVFVRFQTQLALLKQQGVKNVMADAKPLAAEILAADCDALWDTVHIKIKAEARDVEVPITLSPAEAMKRATRAPLNSYEEVWSFLRRRGKKSVKGRPALEGRCPGCGADLPLSEVVRCQFCQAVVNSGEHDWVLAEITQPEEWSHQDSSGEVPGIEELRARDPAVSRQELEDRASVIFWKFLEARATGQRARLDRFCLQPGAPKVNKWVMAKVAVGSADLVAMERGEDGLDRAHIEIQWSAAIDSGEPAGQSSTITLVRSSQATSKRGLSSLDCPNCGGGLAESDAVKCSYCGETLSGAKHEWALESVA